VTVTTTIGATGRDYSTITAWENDSYGLSSADDAVGEVYFSDGNIDETAAIVVINDTLCNSLTLRAASGEEHQGDSSTNAILGYTGANHAFQIGVGSAGGQKQFQDLHLNINGANSFGGIATITAPGNFDNRFSRLLIHGLDSTRNSTTMAGIYLNHPDWNVTNCIIYDLKHKASRTLRGIWAKNNNAQTRIFNNLVLGLVKTSDAARGIEFNDDADHFVRNNIVQDLSASGSASLANYSLSSVTNATTSNNISQDTSSPDGTAFRSITLTFADKAGNDYKLAAGDTDAIDNAADLGSDVGAYGAHIDLSLRNRDTEGDTWDVGPHEYVSSGVSGTAAQQLATLSQSATGDIVVAGTVVQALSTFAQSAAGSLRVTGVASQTLQTQSQLADGTLSLEGSASQVLVTATQLASGELAFEGSASQVLSALSQSALGATGDIAGDIVQTLQTLAQEATATRDATDIQSDHTAIAIWARQAYVPPAVTGFNRIPVWFEGELSMSGSGLVLLAKVPEAAYDVQFHGVHVTDDTSQVLQLGLRHALSASTSISALGRMPMKNVPVWTRPVDIPGYGTGGSLERWKYVTVSRESGTVGSSMVIAGDVTYQCFDF